MLLFCFLISFGEVDVTWASIVRNEDSPSDNDCLKLLESDWFQNLSDNLSGNKFMLCT